MIYLAIEHEHDLGADYYQFKTMYAAINFIVSNDIVDWTLCDRPFLQENGVKTEIPELVAREHYTVIYQ
jgi:hypothetical protein